jgi:16S rRNA (adenine1518-N6/adenine1519-N6)-dimethyltransferase
MTGGPPLLGARRLREVLDRHGARPRKAWGQHFVVDPNTIRKLVSLAELSPSDTVVEVGAGAGSLTLGLAAVAGRVIALEIDPLLMPVLEEVAGDVPNVRVQRADALETDLGALGADVMVGNLPYNIASVLVLKTLEEAPGIKRLTVMTQKEVGERLAAAPGTKTYGATSVMVACAADASIVSRVARNAFYPLPRVDSVVVSIRRRRVPGDAALLRPVVRAAFGQRRKSLRNALSALAGDAGAAEAALRDAGVEPRARAEELTVDDFLALARALASSLGQHEIRAE